MQDVANSISSNHIMFAGNPIFEDMYILELAYWTEGMPMEMYNEMIQMSGIPALPEIKVPSKVIRVVKSDIPDIGKGYYSLENVGMKMYGNFDGCTGCRKCEKGCPEKALTVNKSKEICVRSDLCLGTACKACEMNCPEKVFRFTGLKVSL